MVENGDFDEKTVYTFSPSEFLGFKSTFWEIIQHFSPFNCSCLKSLSWFPFIWVWSNHVWLPLLEMASDKSKRESNIPRRMVWTRVLTGHSLSVLTESLILLMESDRATGQGERKMQSISFNRNSARLLGVVAGHCVRSSHKLGRAFLLRSGCFQ